MTLNEEYKERVRLLLRIIPIVSKIPSVQWKLFNINKLMDTNPQKSITGR
jgi:hypothetical protein